MFVKLTTETFETWVNLSRVNTMSRPPRARRTRLLFDNPQDGAFVNETPEEILALAAAAAAQDAI